MKILFSLLATMGAFSLLALDRQEAQAELAAANRHYEAQQFQEAYEKYKAVEALYNSFELQYNLGNTCYKLNRIAEAILHYERAKKINPLDEDLANNIAVANLKVADKIEAIPTLGVTDFWKNTTSEGSLNRWTWLCIAFIASGFALLALFVWKRTMPMRKAVFALGVTFLLGGAITYLFANSSFRRIESNTEAVVFADKVDVRTSPAETASTAFVIHAGTKVSIRNTSENWMEIRLANGNVGWLRRQDLEVI